MAKYKTSFTLSETARRLLEATADKLGVSQTAVLELAIRDYAKREKVVTSQDLREKS